MILNYLIYLFAYIKKHINFFFHVVLSFLFLRILKYSIKYKNVIYDVILITLNVNY